MTKTHFRSTLALAAALAAAISFPASVFAQQTHDRYIVQFLPGGGAAGSAAVRAAGGQVVLELGRHDAVAVRLPAAALPGLTRNPNVEYIELDPKRYPMAQQTTPYGITMVQADLLDDSSAANRRVCIIDSGYRLDHEDLSNATNVTDSGNRGAGGPYLTTDSHGTHVAGTISALNNGVGVVGVLPNGGINLHIVCVFTDGGLFMYASGLVGALDDCVTADSHVINMSLGGPVKSRTEERAFRNAFNKQNVISVAAAGNGGNNQRLFPASYNAVISVAAINSAKLVADFSQQNNQVELAAPGVAVRSTVVPGTGIDESLDVNGTGYEAVVMEDSPLMTGEGPLVNCGLGLEACPDAWEKVCLIQRGDITFAKKVENCQFGGGVAAVIFNNTPGLFSGTLGGAATTIPSVGISDADGQILLSASGQATVTTLQGDYAYFDGTSMATPHVAGVAALVWSLNEDCSNQEIRNALTSTAEDLGAVGRDNAYGFGLVRAKQANLFLASASNTCDSGGGDPGGGCDLYAKNVSCEFDNQCCSNKCRGPASRKTCK